MSNDKAIGVLRQSAPENADETQQAASTTTGPEVQKSAPTNEGNGLEEEQSTNLNPYEMPEAKPKAPGPESQAVDNEAAPPQKADWRDRLQSLRSEPKAMAALGVVVVVVGFGLADVFGRNKADNDLPAPTVTPQGFPEVDFKDAEGGSYTHGKIAELLAAHKPKESTTAKNKDGERLYTKKEVIAAIQAAQKLAKEQQATRPPAPKLTPRRRRSSRLAPPVKVQPAPVVAPEPEEVEIPLALLGGGHVMDLPTRGSRNSSGTEQYLPPATKFRAKLLVGITSKKHGVVLAQTTNTVTVGETSIAKGTVLRGRSSGRERVFIDFREILIDGIPRKITAQAITGNTPGIPGAVNDPDLRERTGHGIADGTLDTLDSLGRIAGAAGGIPAREAARIGSRALDGLRDEVKLKPDGSVEIPAGIHFEVMVTG